MSDTPILLDDYAMQDFIREGYISFELDLPRSYHKMIYQKIEDLIDTHGNPGNNLHPRIPELQQVFDHPKVHGALQSILGPDYYLHLHRHVHNREPGGKDQNLHKDSLGNSRFAVDEKRRHHHTRWAMLFYYPQDTPIELGPTAVMPKSQYLNTERPEGQKEAQLAGEAGTITIVHYDLLHRGMANNADSNRHMVKYLFTRMSEPTQPSWDCDHTPWHASDHPQEAIWQYIWNWHQGDHTPLAPGSDESIASLCHRLGAKRDIDALQAAYELGRRGPSAVPPLIEALSNQQEKIARNAGYAFNGLGAEAVDALTEASKDKGERIRARAIDALGDMGLKAEAATPDLSAALADPEEDPRRRAAEALGTAGQNQAEALAAPLAQALQQDPSGEVRRNAALSLARLAPQTPAAVPALERGMRDQNHYVRGFSVHALDRIGTPAATRAALRHLQVMRWDGV